jgi:hypothetical protein
VPACFSAHRSPAWFARRVEEVMEGTLHQGNRV